MEMLSGGEWCAIGLVILVMGMSKGGFPVSGMALPLLVLLWPEQGNAARSAVSFMLPLLCAMDIVGAWVYRNHVDWQQIRRLLPGMVWGVAIASLFFVSDRGVAVSDSLLKLLIGVLGLGFALWHILGRPAPVGDSGGRRPLIYGAVAGLTSTIAHAAGPVMQMYLLPVGLSKQLFAGTTTFFFLILNGVKLIPFTLLGRFSTEQLIVNLWLLPLIPLGVLSGYMLVRVMEERHYVRFIQVSLAITSLLLIGKALAE